MNNADQRTLAVRFPLIAAITVAMACTTQCMLLAQETAGTWRAGISREIVTPEIGVWMGGYGGDFKREADGKLHDIWIKALAIEDPQGHRAVLVTSDHQGIPKSMSDRVFAQVRDKFKLDRSEVMITYSHNHCGPRLGDDLFDAYPVDADQEQVVAEFTTLMVEKMVTLIGRSLEALGPAQLQTGIGRAAFAVNRRNNREADVPGMIAKGIPLRGPVDHEVPVMTVTRPDGALAAVLFGYACHPTTLGFTKWCGDYPGFAQLEIEQNHPGACAMFVNTCGGDQNPLPRQKVELCEKYGHLLAEGVEEALKKPLSPVSPSLKTAFAYVDLPYMHVVTRGELEADTEDPNVIKARWAKRLLKKLDAGEHFEHSYPYPIRVWQLGTQMLVIGQGGETVVDYALRFKSEYGSGTWVIGYTDDMIGYVPSRRVWSEGGYEGGWRIYENGHPAYRWNGDIEDRIAATVDRLVQEVRPER